jgi:oligoendopeptidase F
MNYSADIKKLPRHFLPADFIIRDWESLEPYFKKLDEKEIDSVATLEQWMKDASELEAVISEDACWRQIKMTCDTENKELEAAFTFFMMEIQPKIQPYSDKLNKKLLASPFANKLDQKKYFTYLRNVKKNIDLFREENIPIQAELNVLQQRYGVIAGKMTVTVNGEEYTLQQAVKFLEDPDRSLREEVYHKIKKNWMGFFLLWLKKGTRLL